MCAHFHAVQTQVGMCNNNFLEHWRKSGCNKSVDPNLHMHYEQHDAFLHIRPCLNKRRNISRRLTISHVKLFLDFYFLFSVFYTWKALPSRQNVFNKFGYLSIPSAKTKKKKILLYNMKPKINLFIYAFIYFICYLIMFIQWESLVAAWLRW